MKEIRIPEDLQTYIPTEKEIIFTNKLQRIIKLLNL